MRKLFAFLLASLIMIPLATVASASGTTNLTTTVPAATYTLIIPNDQQVAFGETSTQLSPMIAVNDETSFAVGKNLAVTATYDAFKCEGVSTTIPFTLAFSNSASSTTTWKSGNSVTFKGQDDGTLSDSPSISAAMVGKSLYVNITSANWGKALAGEYKATITFTSEVVVSE